MIPLPKKPKKSIHVIWVSESTQHYSLFVHEARYSAYYGESQLCTRARGTGLTGRNDIANWPFLSPLNIKVIINRIL